MMPPLINALILVALGRMFKIAGLMVSRGKISRTQTQLTIITSAALAVTQGFVGLVNRGNIIVIPQIMITVGMKLFD
jgi:hypothetical protein